MSKPDWPTQEIEQLRTLFGVGIAPSEIARRLATGRSRYDVADKLVELKLLKKPLSRVENDGVERQKPQRIERPVPSLPTVFGKTSP